MKKNYLLTMLSLVFCFAIQAQTTIAYTQQNSSYNATFTADGTAGAFDNGANELGMYANGSGAKQVVSWKNFTDDGSTAGSATTMKVGDIFKISLAAYQAFGQIGVSLLSSPSILSSKYARQLDAFYITFCLLAFIPKSVIFGGIIGISVINLHFVNLCS